MRFRKWWRRTKPKCEVATVAPDGYETRCWLARGHSGAHEGPEKYPNLHHWSD